MNRCKFCFKEISEDICLFCGKKQSSHRKAEYKLSPGTLIGGRYLIGGDIGEGGFGITYLAYDNKLDARCAVKEYFPHAVAVRNTETSNDIVCPENGSEYSDGLIRFRNEAEKLSQFYSLKSIVNVRDYVEENNTGYIIMNYVEGISLKNYLDAHKGKISADEVFAMMEPIIRDLSIIQKEGIIHRDISPENIMVTDENKLVLIDFGSAREYEDNKSLSIILKHGYAPPEQYISTGNQGPWTDVYSICATIYRAITGKAPDDSIDLMESCSKTKKPSKLGAKLSAGCEEALMKGLELSYRERLQSCEELHSRLYTESRNVQSERLPKKAFALGAASAAAVILILAVVFAAAGGNDKEEIAAVSGEGQQSDISSEAGSESVTEISEIESSAEVTSEAVTETETTAETTIDVNILASGNSQNGEWELTRDGVLTVDVSGVAGLSSGGWTEYSDKITEVVLGDDVTELRKGAFKDYTNIRSVNFNGKLEKIGEQCFMGCTALESADIPESVALIGRSAFEASGISSLSINGAAQIEDKAFYKCEKLADASLGEAVWQDNSIYIFSNCSQLKSIVLPKNIKIISKFLFAGCSSLTSIVFPESVEEISESAFKDCTSLKEISLPESMNLISSNAFINCSSLRSVLLPKSIKQFDSFSFNGCDNELRIYLPDEFSFDIVNEFNNVNEFIFVGSGKNPVMMELAENYYNVEFTDDYYTENYRSGNIFYINTLYESNRSVFESDTGSVDIYNDSLLYQSPIPFDRSGIEYIVINDDLPFNNDQTHNLEINYFAFSNLKGVYIPSHIKMIDTYESKYGYDPVYSPLNYNITVYSTPSEDNYIERFAKYCLKCDFKYVSSYDEMIKIAKGE